MAYSPPTRAPIVLRSIIYCSNLHLQGNMRPYFQYRLCIFMLLLLLLLSLWHRQHLLSPFPRSTAVFHSCFIQPFQVCFEKMHPKWLQNDPEDSSFKKSTWDLGTLLQLWNGNYGNLWSLDETPLKKVRQFGNVQAEMAFSVVTFFAKSLSFCAKVHFFCPHWKSFLALRNFFLDACEQFLAELLWQ